MKTSDIFRRKLSKLHKKDTILHVTINFSANKSKQWAHYSDLEERPFGTLCNFLIDDPGFEHVF